MVMSIFSSWLAFVRAIAIEWAPLSSNETNLNQIFFFFINENQILSVLIYENHLL